MLRGVWPKALASALLLLACVCACSAFVFSYHQQNAVPLGVSTGAQGGGDPLCTNGEQEQLLGILNNEHNVDNGAQTEATVNGHASKPEARLHPQAISEAAGNVISYRLNQPEDIGTEAVSISDLLGWSSGISPPAPNANVALP